MKEKQRKKFHWWYIPLGIVLVLVLTAGGLVLWMHSMLPWPNMVAMTSTFDIVSVEAYINDHKKNGGC